MTCAACLFWDRYESNAPPKSAQKPIERGECRRYPPEVVVQTWSEVDEYGEKVRTKSEVETRWPTTAADDFCGEGRERPKRPPLTQAEEMRRAEMIARDKESR